MILGKQINFLFKIVIKVNNFIYFFTFALTKVKLKHKVLT